MKQCIYLIILYTILHVNNCTQDTKAYVQSNKGNATFNTVNVTHGENNNSSVPNKIETEGGLINLKPINISHHSYEHGRENSVITTVKPVVVTEKNSAITQTTQINSSSNNNKNSPKVNTTSSTIPSNHSVIPIKVLPAAKNIVGYVGDSKIKPRKGVSLEDISTTQTSKINPTVSTASEAAEPATENITSTPTTIFIPRKPTVTIGSDEEPELPQVMPPRVFIGNKTFEPKNYSATTITKTRQYLIDTGTYRKGHDYVLPIVLTILAVPLLAIILTVVYKRGAEWWQHRHYRRMDFLIDGMYNN